MRNMLGACATSILVGHEVDDHHIAKIFREHRVKNYANAYNASATEEEQEARARGDWKASSEAFKSFQATFHREVNRIKNDGLYVDFKNGQFTSPREAISEELAASVMHLNADFLQRSALFIRHAPPRGNLGSRRTHQSVAGGDECFLQVGAYVRFWPPAP
jgi:AbiV family abortive infection protein